MLRASCKFKSGAADLLTQWNPDPHRLRSDRGGWRASEVPDHSRRFSIASVWSEIGLWPVPL